MSDYKPVRLASAAKKLNVATTTIVGFLEKGGFSVENKPTFKLSEEMYVALLDEFRSDIDKKEEADAVTLGSRNREDIELSEETIKRPKKDEDGEEILIKTAGATLIESVKPGGKEKEPVKEEVVETKKVELDGPKVVGKIELEKKEEKEEVVAETKEAEPVAKTKKEEEPVKRKTAKKEEVEDLIETKKVKLEGPKILGKVELPVEKKKEKAKKETPKDDSPEKKRRRKRIIKHSKVNPNESSRFKDKKKGQKDETQQVSEKEIEEKIKATMAKLAGATGKSARAKFRRAKRQEHAEAEEKAREAENDMVLRVTEFVSVSELAGLMDVSPTKIISTCMGLGVIVSINQRLDAELIELVTSEFDYEVEFVSASDQDDEIEEEYEDAPEDLRERAPIVTIMGHVDHGKTSLLDHIRETNVASGEAGGITQHIGAYEVKTESGKRITFLDTPGHEAFTAMRARGAKLTDVAVIVVAADDAIMPQTKEAISHAQSAGVPMIFAINKIDKEGANPERIKEQLSGMNILVEEWGGKFQSQDLSAKTGENVPQLLEKILLEAELLELKANPSRPAVGAIIEASLDKGRGYVATVLVQTGEMKIGDSIAAGQYFGKVKAMFDHRGTEVKVAGPSVPVQILGLNGAPQAGERLKVYGSDQESKAYATKRGQLDREQGIRAKKHITLDEIGRRLALGTFKELNIIIKGDVDGSVEALSDSLLKLSTDEVQVRIIHKGVGQISESDVLLASASDAIIVAFNVRPSVNARRLAENENIEIRMYSVIYNAIEEVKSAMEGLLEPKIEEKIQGNLEIREVFKITKVGTVAGCFVIDGRVKRESKVRIIRDGIVVYTGELASLRRFKDDVKEVVSGMDCGLNIKDFNDIKVGDIVESYEEIEVQRKLD